MSFDSEKFLELLDEKYSWPDYYRFKFIVKKEKHSELLELISDHKISHKESKNGKYIAVTSRKLIKTSTEIIEIHSKVSTIEGLLSL